MDYVLGNLCAKLSRKITDIIDISVPQTYDNILQSVMKIAQDYEHIINVINLAIKGVLLINAGLFKKYPAYGMDTKIVKENIAKILFIFWRINPVDLYNSDFCENYTLDRELPSFMNIFKWRAAMNDCGCHNYIDYEKLLQRIFLDSVDLRISGCEIK
jgi:hypothetical protein